MVSACMSEELLISCAKCSYLMLSRGIRRTNNDITSIALKSGGPSSEAQ